MSRRLSLLFMLGLLGALTMALARAQEGYGARAQPRQDHDPGLIEQRTPINAPQRTDERPEAPNNVAAAGAPARAGSRCLVCGGACGQGDVEILHCGRRVALHTALCCYDDFKRDPDAYFAAMQARGALFQEPPSPEQPMRFGWFAFGAYVLIGLVFGALCAYVAVGRGLRPLPWFGAGLVVNAVALAVLLTRERADLSALPGGVPAGLRKVPRTRPPVACSACGTLNHPSAAACSNCGAAFKPLVTAETALL
ncbi:MAG: hypothetical protein U1E76_21375 [Planctomycetota bacterium]